MLIAYDQILRGYIAVADTVKSEAKVAVQELKDMNLRTVMITGDNHSTAQAIANEVGIDHATPMFFRKIKLNMLLIFKIKVRTLRWLAMVLMMHLL